MVSVWPSQQHLVLMVSNDNGISHVEVGGVGLAVMRL